MEEVLKFLKDVSTFYLATIDGDQPRVRPFGAVTAYEGRLYLITSNQKDVFRQLQANPKLELCGMDQKGNWLRVEATTVEDSDRNVKRAMLEEYPDLKNLYSVDDGKMEVLYLHNVRATFSSFTAEPLIVNF